MDDLNCGRQAVAAFSIKICHTSGERAACSTKTEWVFIMQNNYKVNKACKDYALCKGWFILFFYPLNFPFHPRVSWSWSSVSSWSGGWNKSIKEKLSGRWNSSTNYVRQSNWRCWRYLKSHSCVNDERSCSEKKLRILGNYRHLVLFVNS